MAMWGERWYGPGGNAARPNARLNEAFGFGDDLRYGGDGGAAPRSRGVGAVSSAAAAFDERGGLADEVPHVFSMKAQQPFGVAGGAYPNAAASPFPRFGMGGFGGGFSSPADVGMGMSSSAGSGSAPYGDRCWVTVFGFPGRTASLVRQQLETLCGPIVEVRNGDGNFLHVRFHNAAAAEQCLAHNGRTLMGKLLIGCVPCTSNLADGSGSPDGGMGSEADVRPGAFPMSEPDGGTGGPCGGGDYGVGGPPVGPRSAPPPPPASRGPQVSRGGFIWRIVDLLFDI